MTQQLAPTLSERVAHLPPVPTGWDRTRNAEDDYHTAVVDAITNHPRSLQKRIGPSEIGQACKRRLAYKILGQPERPQPPNWKATIGTGAHMWLETAFDRANETWATSNGNCGVERYLIEERVIVGTDARGHPITGSCDLYDRLTATVIDHKTVGDAQLAKYRKTGPGEQYRTQAHLYGAGWINAGLEVKQVAISFLPRNNDLARAYWWSEPYNPDIAAQAIQAFNGLQIAADLLGHALLDQLPAVDNYCSGCPFYQARSTNLAQGCPGANPAPANENTLTLTGK